MTFPLELVRDSVTSDVTAFLARMDAAAAELAEQPAWTARAAFASIAVQCHGIAGTTSLVGLGSLTAAARLLEDIAERGQALVAEVEERAARARALGGLYVECGTALRAILERELAGDGATATQLAERLAARIAAAEPAEPAGAAASTRLAARPPAPLALDAARPPTPAPAVVPAPAPAAPPPVAPGSIPAELRAIFVEEARAAVKTLRELLAALAAAPGPATAEPVERLFHTLKGAAATVGLADIAELARSLQLRLAAAVDGDEAIDATFIADVTRDAVWLFELAGAETSELASRAAGDPQALFHAEAGRLLDRAEAELASGPVSPAALADLFHRLKGSALVVGLAEIAAVAGELEARVRRPDATADGARAAFDRMAAALGRRRAAAAPARSSPRAIRFTLGAAIDPELWEAFSLECHELLDGLDRAILELETAARPRPLLEQLFRHYHTLKGSVNTIGLRPLGAVIHDVEDVLERVLADRAPPPGAAIARVLLEAQALVKRGLAQAAHGHLELDPAPLARHLAGLGTATPVPTSADPPSVASLGAPPSAGPSSAGPDSVAGSAPPSAGDDTAIDRRYIRVPLERFDDLMNLAGELVIGRSRLVGRSGLLRNIQRDLGLSRRRLLDTVDRFASEHEFANLDGRRAGDARERRGGAPALGFSELELDRYEGVHILARSLTEISSDFSELDGELVHQLQSFHEDADRLGAIVSSLQAEITRARLIPVESLFARLRLPIRDAAERDGKDVRVVMRGEDVALDKSIVDALLAPMLHLVRNAVSHGVEPAAERAARGKPLAGTVTLTARQQAGQIAIEVADDGGGLDLVRLRARGAALGLVAATTPLDDPAIRDLVFAPGVSTAAAAGAVAGRGIGGNVVKRAIERMSGDIQVASSPAGTTFTITLPITLAITRAVIVRCGEAQFAIPLYFAEGVRDRAEVTVVESAGVLRVLEGGAYVPVKRMSELLDGAPTPGSALVMVRVGAAVAGLEVDAVVAQEEIVVKPLGPILDGHPLFAGVTFRGTGDLALILDVPSLVETVGARPAAAAIAPAAAPAAEPAAPVRPRPRVLFIDDSVSVRKVAERLLAELGCEVTVAIDGVDGMARLRAGHFDLVFTDLEMPRMHGYELLREIRYVPAYRELPVIVVSSRSGGKHQDQARALGATDYVTKPFSAELLAGVLHRWLAHG